MDPKDRRKLVSVQGGYKGAPPTTTNQTGGGKKIVPPQGGSGTSPPKGPPKKMKTSPTSPRHMGGLIFN